MQPDSTPDLLREGELRAQGYKAIAGVDEAGRGPLAGPVVAAAVVLPEALDHHALAGVRDSKQLNPAQREQFYQTITQHAESYAIAQASPQEIDLINIRQASLLAMKRAVEQLDVLADYALVDGRDTPDLTCPREAIIKGDQRSVIIGAASILAKVVRDRIMEALHLEFPLYGWRYHKGYPTPYHRNAVQLFGASPHHRKTFGGVRDWTTPIVPAPALLECFQVIEATASLDELKALKATISTEAFTELEQAYLLRTLAYRCDHIKAAKVSATTSGKGKRWETYAANWLCDQGYVIWETNFRISGGEIDIIANRGSAIIFVEVKARSSDAFGSAEEALTPTKRKRLIRTAERYLSDRSLLDGWDIRYDLIAMDTRNADAPVINHIPDVFRVEEDFA